MAHFRSFRFHIPVSDTSPNYQEITTRNYVIYNLGLAETEPIVFRRAADKRLREKRFLDQFTGDYEVMGLTLSVSVKGEHTLWLTITGQPPYELEPASGTDFHLKEHTNFSIGFKRDEAGAVTEAVLRQPQGIFTAKRIAST